MSSLSDVQWLSTLAWLEQSGVESSSSAKFIEIPFGAMTAAVEDGRGDAAVLVSPRLDSAVHSGRVRVLGPVYDGIAKHFLVTVWYAMDGYVKSSPDIVRRFAGTVREANAYCQSHPAETLPIIAAFEKIDPMAFTSWRGIAGIIKPTLRPGSLEELIRILPRGIGVIPMYNVSALKALNVKKFLGVNYLPGPPFNKVQELSSLEVYRFVREQYLEHRNAEAIYMLGPAWHRSIDVVEMMERDFGIPIVHHITAQSWEFQKRWHVNEPISGYGRLLSELPPLPG